MTTRAYKNYKSLKKENLRDNMSTTEIILNMLAETATKIFLRLKIHRHLKKINLLHNAVEELQAMREKSLNRKSAIV